MNLKNKPSIIDNITTMDACIHDEKIFFHDVCYSEIFSYDISKKKLHIMKTDISNSDILSKIYRRIFYINNTIILIYNNGVEVSQFSINGESLDYVCSNCDKLQEGKRIKNAFYHDGKIYIVPCLISDAIYVYDIQNNEFKSFLLDLTNVKVKKLIINKVEYCHGKFLMTLDDNHAVFFFDLYDRKLFKFWEGCDKDLSGMSINENMLAVRSKDGNKIYILDMQNSNVIEEIYTPVQELYGNLIFASYDILLMQPNTLDTLNYIDKKRTTGVISLCNNIRSKEGSFSIGNIIYNNHVYILPWASKGMIDVDLKNMNSSIINVDLTAEDRFYMNKKIFNEKTVVYERENTTIARFIEYMING